MDFSCFIFLLILDSKKKDIKNLMRKEGNKLNPII